MNLHDAAIAIVASGQPLRADALVSRLRADYGASTADANRTLLELLRDGALHRTAWGGLVLPGYAGSGRAGVPAWQKVLGVTLIVLIAVFIGWVFFNLIALQ